MKNHTELLQELDSYLRIEAAACEELTEYAFDQGMQYVKNKEGDVWHVVMSERAAVQAIEDLSCPAHENRIPGGFAVLTFRHPETDRVKGELEEYQRNQDLEAMA